MTRMMIYALTTITGFSLAAPPSVEARDKDRRHKHSRYHGKERVRWDKPSLSRKYTPTSRYRYLSSRYNPDRYYYPYGYSYDSYYPSSYSYGYSYGYGPGYSYSYSW